MATRESMLGLPWNRDLKPPWKKFRPQYSTGTARISCSTAKFMGWVCMEKRSGRGRAGSPKGSICPMDTYSSTAENTAAAISSTFRRFRAAASASSASWAAAGAGCSRCRAAPKPAFSTFAMICSWVHWLSS